VNQAPAIALGLFLFDVCGQYCSAKTADMMKVALGTIRLAHVTNTMGQAGDDFEKGEADGTREALAALGVIIAGVQEPT
jgi:hypothetical protein